MEELEEPLGDRLRRARTSRTGSVRPDSWRQLRDVVGVLHEPDVEHEVGLERHAELVAEADQLDRDPVGLGRRRRAARTAARATRAATGRTCR